MSFRAQPCPTIACAIKTFHRCTPRSSINHPLFNLTTMTSESSSCLAWASDGRPQCHAVTSGIFQLTGQNTLLDAAKIPPSLGALLPSPLLSCVHTAVAHAAFDRQPLRKSFIITVLQSCLPHLFSQRSQSDLMHVNKQLMDPSPCNCLHNSCSLHATDAEVVKCIEAGEDDCGAWRARRPG